ncbi:hypothetical protein GCM10014719_54470 [Planomonospora parontospora subsp. antibiotica]|nr:hypothetical protein GCM10014719_54470 [Planomonospora parontospora subsp. antibiotica]GII16185.1 hypothetical protein Ppa05_29110 [Planomonospora parontospora subsp. antibiotica]
MGLRADFDPETRKVRVSVDLAPSGVFHGKPSVSEDGLEPKHYARLACEDISLDGES